jgi:hypothetical protein
LAASAITAWISGHIFDAPTVVTGPIKFRTGRSPKSPYSPRGFAPANPIEESAAKNHRRLNMNAS